MIPTLPLRHVNTIFQKPFATNRARFAASKKPAVQTIQIDSDVNAPVLGFGTWKAKPNQVKEAVKHAIKVGYRHIDCAPVYQNETEVGDAINESIASGIVKREDLFITSKLWNTYHKPELVHKGLDKTLNDLRLEYLDLYIIHWPVAFVHDGLNPYPKKQDNTPNVTNIPLSDTWEAMQDLKAQRLTRSLGVSNFTVNHLQEILKESKVKPAVNQIEMHPYLTQKQLVKFCQEHKITITAYSPLGTGIPAQKDESKPVLLEDKAVLQLATQYNKTPAQILLRWSIQNGFITIPKSVTPSRIEENYNVFDFQLTEADMAKLDQLDKNQRHVIPVWSVFAK